MAKAEAGHKVTQDVVLSVMPLRSESGGPLWRQVSCSAVRSKASAACIQGSVKHFSALLRILFVLR